MGFYCLECLSCEVSRAEVYVSLTENEDYGGAGDLLQVFGVGMWDIVVAEIAVDIASDTS
ncbi:unnamed protein product [marine sediment metagenome]|uniref:Uncharacterized protein n=1 Tax=marine sediment metagenome TaxID=412755 RepID=X1FEE1_9ZZZZ